MEKEYKVSLSGLVNNLEKPIVYFIWFYLFIGLGSLRLSSSIQLILIFQIRIYSCFKFLFPPF